jgi:hypothetical protein
LRASLSLLILAPQARPPDAGLLFQPESISIQAADQRSEGFVLKAPQRQ